MELLKIGIIIFVTIIAMTVYIAVNYYQRERLREQDFNEMYKLYEEAKKKTERTDSSSHIEMKINREEKF